MLFCGYDFITMKRQKSKSYMCMLINENLLVSIIGNKIFIVFKLNKKAWDNVKNTLK